MEKYMYKKTIELQDQPSISQNNETIDTETVTLHEHGPIMSQDKANVLIEAACGEAILKTYETALQVQTNDMNAFKTAIKLFGGSVKHNIDALTTMQKSMLTLYQENWPFFREIQLCMEDEKKIWKNLERDMHEIPPLFRKYEASSEIIEQNVKHRNALLEKLKAININVLEMKAKGTQKKTLRKIERELTKTERSYSVTHGQLMDEYPKILVSRVRCLCQIFTFYAQAMKDFCSEMQQVHKLAMDFIRELPKSNPKIFIGDDADKLVISLRQTKFHQLPKKQESLGLPPPSPPPPRPPTTSSQK